MIDDAASSDDAAAAITTWDARPSQGEPWIEIQVPSCSDACRKAA